MMACDLASSPDGYVYVIFSLVLSLSHLCVLTQGTLLTFTGESAPQVPLMLLVPPLPIAYVGLRRPTFPRRPAQARTQNWPG